jgi:hypothetical protein
MGPARRAARQATGVTVVDRYGLLGTSLVRVLLQLTTVGLLRLLGDVRPNEDVLPPPPLA